MKKGSLLNTLWRTFFIHTALNFRRMQNLGFAYAMISLLKHRKMADREAEEMLVRHLQRFNTHPYLSAPLVGSILRMEEDRRDGEDAAPIAAVKQSLMGPYAAIGDSFFWGALRPCAGICAAGLAWLGCAFAPLAFLLIYSPAHFWVRGHGFFESYRRGKKGIETIHALDLPGGTGRIRWLSLAALAAGGLWIFRTGYTGAAREISAAAVAAAITALVFVCGWLMKRGVSQIYLLYGAAALFMIFSTRGLWLCWR